MRNEELEMKNSAGRGENAVLDKSYDFALEIIELYKEMSAHKEFVLSKQLLRSGTSIGANIEEAQAGQSRSDFVHKMSVACKEARETRYWLRLVHKSQLCPVDCTALLQGAEELLRLLNSIIKTTRGKQGDHS
jgi:four helix bundle protein